MERVVAEADCGLKWCVPCLSGNFIQAAPARPTCTHIHPGAAGPCGRALKGYIEGRAQGVVSLHGGGSENLKMREIVMGVGQQPVDVTACKVAR